MKKTLLLIISFFVFINCWSQNVGIGTNTPFVKLHIKDTMNNSPVIIDGKGPMWVTLAEGGVNRGYFGSYSGNPEDVDFGTYGGNLTGKVHLTSGNDIPRLTVMPNGNVGINNQNAQRKLDVSGDLKADSVFITGANTATDFLVVKDANGQVGHRKSFYGLGINYCIALQGIFPSQNKPTGVDSTTNVTAYQPFIGEIMLFAGTFPPAGWAFCQGQLQLISQNTALFSILGTTYGGDGKTTFALPDLRNAVPVGFGNNWQMGESNK
jgi:microcystin-dependent protein